MVVIRGRLAPEVGAVVRRALEAALDEQRRAEPTRESGEPDPVDEAEGVAPSFGQRQADALGMVAECALAGGLDGGTAGDRYQVVVHVDAATLTEDADVPAGTSPQAALEEAGGIHVSAATAQRLACDSAVVAMRHGPTGQVLDVGRKRRTISPALRRALAARDRQCQFPGCQARRCDAHHIRHWAHGGATALDNLVLLCRRHHRAVHEEGFRVTVDPSGTVQFVRPDGHPLAAAPAAPDWDGLPLEPTATRLAAAGIDIDANTATPAWRGERLDLKWAIGIL